MPMRLASAIVSLLSQIFLVAMVRGQSAPERLPTLFEEPLSPRIANYQIDVSLDPANRTLRGKQVLTWYNQTEETLTELQFHLYLNAFRNSRTTFMRESGGTMRGHAIDE